MSKKSHVGLKYYSIKEITGPLIFCKSVSGVSFGEIVKVLTPSEGEKIGQVIDISDEITVIQVFEGTSGLSIETTAVRFTGETLKLPVSMDMFPSSLMPGVSIIIPPSLRITSCLRFVACLPLESFSLTSAVS